MWAWENDPSGDFVGFQSAIYLPGTQVGERFDRPAGGAKLGASPTPQSGVPRSRVSTTLLAVYVAMRQRVPNDTTRQLVDRGPRSAWR